MGVKNRGMARTSFGRTVIKTICEVRYYDSDNEKQTTEIELYGDYDYDTARKPLCSILGTTRLIVENIRHKSFYGKMTFEDFAKVCEKSNEKEW